MLYCLLFLLCTVSLTHGTIILWDLNDVLIRPYKSLDRFLYSENDRQEEMLHRFNTHKKAIPGMLELVKELYMLGYEQHIASNISPTAFAFLTDPVKSPHLKNLFMYIDLEKSVTYMYHNKKLLKKPNPEYFRAYLKKNDLDPTSGDIIFIDDKKENVQAAESVGLYGICFQHVSQLRNALNVYMIPVSIE